MTDNPYQAAREGGTAPAARPDRAWKTASRIAGALVLFLLVDSAFSASDQLARSNGGSTPRPSRCPTLYIGVQEFLVGLSPRMAAFVPAGVLFLRITSFFTAIGLAAGALARIASQGRWRMRTPQLVPLLLVSLLLGTAGTWITLHIAAQEAPRFDFFAAPHEDGARL